MNEDEVKLLRFLEYWFSLYNYTPTDLYISEMIGLSKSKTISLLNKLMQKGYIDIYTYPELKQRDIVLKTKSSKTYKATLFVDKFFNPLRLESDFKLTLQIVDPTTFQIVEIKSNGKL